MVRTFVRVYEGDAMEKRFSNKKIRLYWGDFPESCV